MKYLVLFALCFGITTTQACVIRLSVENTGTSDLYVYNSKNTTYTAVKTKGGFWRSLKKGKWIDEWHTKYFYANPEEKLTDYYYGNLGCNLNRRYRIRFKCEGGKYNGQWFTKYYPSSSSWTKNRPVNIPIDKCVQ